MLPRITSQQTSNQGAPSQVIGPNKLIKQPTNKSSILQAMDREFAARTTYSLRAFCWPVSAQSNEGVSPSHITIRDKERQRGVWYICGDVPKQIRWVVFLALFSFLYLKKSKFQKYMSVLKYFKTTSGRPMGGDRPQM